MDQISRPLLIALIAVVGFAGVWMLVLRPRAQSGGDDAAAAPPAAASSTTATPATTGLGRAAQGAKGAVAASEASASAAEEAAAAASADAPATPAATPAAPPTATTPVPAAPAPKPVAEPRATVLLFTGNGADDAVAREVVRAVKRPGVRTIVASIEHVGDYANLVGSVEILGAPTILVIGRDRTAQRIVGLPDVAQVEQALAAIG